jgi:acetolactate synthase I/II/III large subunit
LQEAALDHEVPLPPPGAVCVPAGPTPDPNRAHIGMDLFGPAPDFAGLARSMGWWAEGPIENAYDLQPALQRAVAQVKTGKPALVDAVTQHR